MFFYKKATFLISRKYDPELGLQLDMEENEKQDDTIFL